MRDHLTQPSSTRPPDVVLVLADDMGFSDIGCYGGEIDTPNLDRLAADGVRFAQFYNTARCSPSRASLLTGLHPHQTGIGILTEDQRPHGYRGSLNRRCLTIAEVLGRAGYRSYLSGKWHLSSDTRRPDETWPTRRGFDEFFGTITGAGNYYRPTTLTRGETPATDADDQPDFYYTDAISQHAVQFVHDHVDQRADQPFFLYVAYTAPHWPLHARQQDIELQRGRYDAGWDELRRARHRRLGDLGVIDERLDLPRDPRVPDWRDVTDKAWEISRMEAYAAQVHAMDRGIGELIAVLEQESRLENTVFMFLSDNGGCAENLPNGWVDELGSVQEWTPTQTRTGTRIRCGNDQKLPVGREDSFQSYGRSWAHLSNTPFREYKHWVHEGGIATPLIIHWPSGPRDSAGSIVHQPHQLPDVMATIVDITGVPYPVEHEGAEILPLEGSSLLAAISADPKAADRPLFWEHEGNAAVRRGEWKLVRKHPGDWELYDMGNDRAEIHDQAAGQPALVQELAECYRQWAERCGVIPRDQLLAAAGRPHASWADE